MNGSELKSVGPRPDTIMMQFYHPPFWSQMVGPLFVLSFLATGAFSG